jgi:dihydrodipicolinate synthase/N-acetylneuraminate lyase
MRTQPIEKQDWRGVFAVPPLARKADKRRTFDWRENDRLIAHLHEGGITRLIYGGNAFVYHLSLAEYEALLDWLASRSDDLWCIPSAGPSFGRLEDQAGPLRTRKFPAVMHLPCGDPRDAGGLEAGLAEFAEASGTPLILYVKDESNFGADRERGLDAIARLVDRGLCIGIKYAVPRADPAVDPYLAQLLQRVDRSIVLSGIGERPAIAHMERFGLAGYTTGSGCIGAGLTSEMFRLCSQGKYAEAAPIREQFLPLEDIRDQWGPARVLHAAVGAAGITDCGPIPPFVSAVSAEVTKQLPAAVSPLLGAMAAKP